MDQTWLPVIVGLSGMGLILFEMKRTAKGVDNMLFDKSGEAIYMTAVKCEKQQTAFRVLICNKIDGIKIVLTEMRGEMKEMDEKREDARADIAQFIGSVQTYIDMNEKNKGRL